MEYKEYELGELIEYRNEKLLIENVSLENYISTENLLPNRNGKQNAEKLPNTKSVKKYYENDILISNIRPYFKKIWQAEIPGGASNDVLILNSCSNNTTNDYLYYYLSQDKFFDYMTQTAKGTKMPRGDKKAILGYEIKVPNIKHIQNYIVNLGKNIDKKIETNKKIIANLEELSQTLFNRWFVDFEFPDENGNPYKSSGGEMVDSEIGEIPKEWYIKSINEITSRVRTGLNPRKNFVLGYGENYYVTIKNMSNNNIYLNEKCDRINDEALKIINKRSDLKKNDILFSGIGTIGRVYLVSEKPENWNISESIFTLRPSESLYSYYLYQLMLSENLQNYVQQLSSGSVQKGIRKGDLIKFKLPMSKNNFIENLYSNKIKNYIFKVQNLRKENLKLVKLRDTLLPKLMSGEIEIPDDIEVNEDELSI
ncbi:restriction endonuclease subunit S [Staphylococcus cohnii]|nr:restriction endonuclease subunit S [Staphylococcus cohnii]